MVVPHDFALVNFSRTLGNDSLKHILENASLLKASRVGQLWRCVNFGEFTVQTEICVLLVEHQQ